MFTHSLRCPSPKATTPGKTALQQEGTETPLALRRHTRQIAELQPSQGPMCSGSIGNTGTDPPGTSRLAGFLLLGKLNMKSLGGRSAVRRKGFTLLELVTRDRPSISVQYEGRLCNILGTVLKCNILGTVLKCNILGTARAFLFNARGVCVLKCNILNDSSNWGIKDGRDMVRMVGVAR
jgi:hypothetical protein